MSGSSPRKIKNKSNLQKPMRLAASPEPPGVLEALSQEEYQRIRCHGDAPLPHSLRVLSRQLTSQKAQVCQVRFGKLLLI